MPPAERRALLILLVVALVGHVTVTWLHRPGPGAAPGDVRILGPASGEDLQAHRDSAAAANRPLGENERVDIDRAPVASLARLPRVGEGMARKIVDYRTAHGPFGSLEALNQVPGIGDGLIEAIRDHVEFSLAGQVTAPPAADPFAAVRLAAPSGQSATRAGKAPVDLNQADQAALEGLPGVGPYMARRIVEYRDRHGAFVAVDSLVRVGGIGPATLERIRGMVMVR